LGKIAASHLERKACVYVRQSSMVQAQHHRESTQRQYNLRERAITLGLRAGQVEVINEDQGQSALRARPQPPRHPAWENESGPTETR